MSEGQALAVTVPPSHTHVPGLDTHLGSCPSFLLLRMVVAHISGFPPPTGESSLEFSDPSLSPGQPGLGLSQTDNEGWSDTCNFFLALGILFQNESHLYEKCRISLFWMFLNITPRHLFFPIGVHFNCHKLKNLCLKTSSVFNNPFVLLLELAQSSKLKCRNITWALGNTHRGAVKGPDESPAKCTHISVPSAIF